MDNNTLCLTVINQWKQDYQNLFEVLSNEQMALEKRDFEALADASVEKQHWVNIINRHEVAPQLVQQSSHGDAKFQRYTLVDFKNHCYKSEETQQGWIQLMELVSKCSFQNEVNGRLLQLVQEASKRTFNLIRGFDPDNNIYDSSGSRSMVSTSRASVSA
ncbi:flagella synthesis protein FlgN [Aliikangiella sp. G2MR2-5]|uniref:flagella synthesis protein FlgN n=1 Tax=Aliikangiella sp. G2MR2-5 TaxID=2788943 RepID=UPI0018A966D0|nr:flagellar protein FlgN [Aliikangiella sp. G2MR2-5]